MPCGPIYSVDQVFQDPQVKHLQMARSVDHGSLGEIDLVGQAINLSRTPEPERLRMATPEFGEHTNEILQELGYDLDQLEALKKREVI